MKISFILLISVVFIVTQTTSASNNQTGEQLFKTYCDACHGMSGGMDMSKRIAPPVAAIKMHYGQSYSNKEPFIAAIVNWLDKPDESKSLMKGAIKKFNLMPPISVSKEDANKIAHFIFNGNIESPEGFDEHVQQMHGKRGKGKGKGKN